MQITDNDSPMIMGALPSRRYLVFYEHSLVLAPRKYEQHSARYTSRNQCAVFQASPKRCKVDSMLELSHLATRRCCTSDAQTGAYQRIECIRKKGTTLTKHLPKLSSMEAISSTYELKASQSLFFSFISRKKAL